jgi:hypothetical protein
LRWSLDTEPFFLVLLNTSLATFGSFSIEAPVCVAGRLRAV